MCKLVNGDPPAGYETAHSCGNGHLRCITPKHLHWKTPAQNQQENSKRGNTMLDTVKQLLKFNVLNRFSGKVQFTAEIDCAADASERVKLGLAIKWAIKSGANLSGADLSGADLSGADLSGQWIIQGASRSDGYAFFLQKLTADTEPMVKAGCRHFTLSEAQRHWEKTRAGTALLTETKCIVRCMIELAQSRGLMKEAGAWGPPSPPQIARKAPSREATSKKKPAPKKAVRK
jgi:hypothetical protein